jgi:RNA polymerase sigma-70 factor (ECF subfamily)
MSIAHQSAPPDMIQTQEQFITWALKEYERPLIGYAQGFVHDHERARDVVQDTFIRLCQQDIAKVRDGVKTWLFTVCRNRALDILRKDSRLVEMDENKVNQIAASDPSPEESLDHEESMEQLNQVMKKLKKLQKNLKKLSKQKQRRKRQKLSKPLLQRKR